MKIAIDGREANGSDGKARYIREIIKGISRNCPKDAEITILSKQKLNFEMNPKFVFCQLPKTIYPFSTNLWLRRKLIREKFDLFFAPTGYLPVVFSPIKTVVAIHDLAVYRNDTRPKLKTKLIEIMLLPMTVKKCQAIIVPSLSTKNDILMRFGKHLSSKIHITPYAVGTEFKYLNLKRENFILSVSTIEPRKNLITLLYAYRLLSKEIKKQYRLKIAGNVGWNSTDFENELKSEDYQKQIDMLGRVTDEELVSLYNRAALFVYPSLFEGFGLPVVEAMSCGVPVITSDNSSLPEAGGKAALYLKNPKDEKELSGKMMQILNSPDQQIKLSHFSLEQAKKFSWDNTVSQTLELFYRVINS